MTDELKECRDLLPCPFCGRTPYSHECEEMTSPKGLEIICLYQDCVLGGIGINQEKWQSRAKPDGVDIEVLDPDMPAQELLLHMGELSDNEIRVARAAIRWANSRYLTAKE